MNFRFRRFQTRILVFVMGLLTLLSALTFGAVSLALTRNARAQISTELAVGGRVFTRLITARTQELAGAARLLSGDFAFKTAALGDDAATTLSVLDNHRARIRADVMQFVSLERNVLADTLHKDAVGAPFVLPDLIARAEQEREASAIVMIDGRPYQMVAVPLLTPLPVAWICVGFIIDDQVARDLQQLTRLQVSFLGSRPDGGRTVLASTLPGPAREPLLHLPSESGQGVTQEDQGTLSLRMQDGEYVTLVTPLDKASGRVTAVLQRSLDEALRPYRRLQVTLLILTAAGLVASVGGAVIIARRVTRPVLTVVEGARQVERGDYGHTVSVNLSDEIGELASTFNVMTQGLAERDRVRAELERVNRLKGFLSPQVVDVIVSSGDEAVLASHRREITAVFCDMRGFTAFGEQGEPEEVMRFLSAYHDAVGPLVFQYEGTLEQFIGDGVMVFFNDPLPLPDHAARAVRLAIDMRERMTELLETWRGRGFKLGFGVGIAVGFATLGKIGFSGRFDYAAIGSVCNLAARLCSEARDGQILVSQAIATTVEEFVELETIPPLTLKGFGGTVPAYNVLKLKEPGHALA